MNYIFQNFSLLYDFDSFDTISISHNAIDSDLKSIVVNKSESSIPVEKPILSVWKNKSIPFLFNSEHSSEIISKQGNQTIINYDILSPIFYLLSGKQEIDSKSTDQYGRFQYKDSLQHKFNFVEIPLVNYYFDILKTAIELAYNIKINLKHNFSTCLTHDIDEVESGWKHRIRLKLEQKQFIKAGVCFINHLVKPFFPWRNLEEIMVLETEKGIKSTFFILTKNSKVGEIKNADYELTSNYIKKQLLNMTNKGFEIGVHGSYKTHLKPNDLTRDLALLPKEITGNRFHFLQWDMKKTPKVIEENKLKYDTTLGFQEQIGFRNGICNPFYLYNFETERAYEFLEIPLVVMDCTLAYGEYMNISPKNSIESLKNLSEEVKKFGGVLTVNWHNTFLSNYVNLEWKKVYFELIDKLKNEDSNFDTCLGIVKKYAN